MFEADRGLGVSLRPQKCDHFPKCGNAGILSSSRRNLLQYAADGFGKEVSIGPTFPQELSQGLGCIQRDVTALFGGSLGVKPPGLQSLRQAIPVRLGRNDNGRAASHELSANEAAQFIKQRRILAIKLYRVLRGMVPMPTLRRRRYMIMWNDCDAHYDCLRNTLVASHLRLPRDRINYTPPYTNSSAKLGEIQGIL